MSTRLKKAFSLTEVLMAAGILAIGFMLIAMIFPVGIKLTASATEKTIGVIAAKEAEAKLKLYADDPLTIDFRPINIRFRVDGPTGLNELMLFENVVAPASIFFTTERYQNPDTLIYYNEKFYDLLYPSRNYCCPEHYPVDEQVDIMRYQTHIEEASYRWTALCARIGNTNEVETLILVTRKISKNATFPIPERNTSAAAGVYGYVDKISDPATMSYPYTHPGYWPMPVRVDLICVDAGLRIWKIYNTVPSSDPAYPSPADGNYINKGDTVIDSLYNGIAIEHFQVVDKDRHGIELNGDLKYDILTGIATVWVVPPAAGSARSPLIGVYSGGPIVFN